MDPNIQQLQQQVDLQSTRPNTNGNHNSWKIAFFSLLGIVLLAAIGFGGYYLGTQKNATNVENGKISGTNEAKVATPIPTTIPTITQNVNADWQTYKNSTFGYSFQYPAKWYLFPPEKTTALDLQIVSPASPSTIDLDGAPNGDYIDIFVEDNSSNLSISDWTQKKFQTTIKLTEQTINGIVWERTTDYPFFIGGEAAFTEQNGKIFDVVWTKKVGDVSSDTFEHILSSFTFSH